MIGLYSLIIVLYYLLSSVIFDWIHDVSNKRYPILYYPILILSSTNYYPIFDMIIVIWLINLLLLLLLLKIVLFWLLNTKQIIIIFIYVYDEN